jgi:glutamine amidotransferase
VNTLIGIIDADLGNLRSASNAIYSLGHDFRFVRSADHMEDLSHLIIPGVGSYAKAMRNLGTLALTEPILRFANTGRPVLGICLGMQILSEQGEEVETTKGLGLLKGTVRLLEDRPGYAVPHVGWNAISPVREHPILANVKKEVDFYFVHSYYFAPLVSDEVICTTEYGHVFSSIVARANVVGFQFHPEKSQAKGLQLLENFCAWDGVC